MNDLFTLDQLNKRAARKAHDEAGRRLRAEFNALAHTIADHVTLGLDTQELALEYTITQEALKLHDAKQVA